MQGTGGLRPRRIGRENLPSPWKNQPASGSGTPATPASSSNTRPERGAAARISAGSASRALVTYKERNPSPPKATSVGRGTGTAITRLKVPSGSNRTTLQPSRSAVQRPPSASSASPPGRPDPFGIVASRRTAFAPGCINRIEPDSGATPYSDLPSGAHASEST